MTAPTIHPGDRGDRPTGPTAPSRGWARASLDWRRSDDNGLVGLCREQGIAFVPFFTISGLRREAAAAREQDARVHAVARAHGATPAQIRLAWTLHRGPHLPAIPGIANPAHLAENIAADALRLTEQELALLDKPGETGP